VGQQQRDRQDHRLRLAAKHFGPGRAGPRAALRLAVGQDSKP